MNLRVWSRIAGLGLLTLVLGPLLFQASGEVAPADVVYVASTSGGSVGGVAFADEDVLAYDVDAETWSIHMDGSALGIGVSLKVDGFHARRDGGVLFSLSAPGSLPNLGLVDDSDVLQFLPDPAGSPSSGALSMFFDGSDYGLTSAGEDVDAVTLDGNGRLVISTAGSVSAPFGRAADEDLLVLGSSGLELFLDGSAVGLGAGPEDVVGVSIDPSGAINVSTHGNYNVAGASGGKSDVARCEIAGQAVPVTGCTWTTAWLAAGAGFHGESMNGLTIDTSQTTSTTTTTTTTTTTATTTTTTSTTATTTTTTATTTTSTTTATSTTTTEPPLAGGPVIDAGSILLTSTSSGNVGGVAFADEDVVLVDGGGNWTMYFDGSDIGVPASHKIDGFAVTPDGTVLFSLNLPTSLPGIGAVDDSDVVALTPTSLGESTIGTLSLRFDGSNFGLTSNGEDVDAIAVALDGSLLLSTTGSVSAPFGNAADEDVLAFDGSQLSLFLDGSAAGLGAGPEDVVGLSVQENGAIHLSTTGNYSVQNAAGAGNDLVQCLPVTTNPITRCAWGNYWDGAQGYGSEQINAVHSGAMVGHSTDFDGPLGPEWVVYDSIGHAGWGLRRPSAVTIERGSAAATSGATSGGVLTITAEMGTGGDEAGLLVSGGLKLRVPQTYGRYTMRVRTDPDPDQVTSGAVLLWPESNQHPRDGEIDVLESWTSRVTRTPMESNLHWLRPGATEPYEPWDDLKAQVVHAGVDGTRWHVYQLVWRQDLVSVSVDGGPPVVLSTNPAEIASWNMEPTIQLDAFDSPTAPGQQPTMGGTVRMQVDYLIIEP